MSILCKFCGFFCYILQFLSSTPSATLAQPYIASARKGGGHSCGGCSGNVVTMLCLFCGLSLGVAARPFYTYSPQNSL